VVTIVILACFKKFIGDDEGKYGDVDAIWRIQMGLALVPAFATLWPRLRMPEGKKYIEFRGLNSPASLSSTSEPQQSSEPKDSNSSTTRHATPGSVNRALAHVPNGISDLENLSSPVSRIGQFGTFFIYVKEWRHLKTLLGTASCWFLLDIAFYGTNLNQSVLLADIGFFTGKIYYDVLTRNAIGTLIIAVSGYVPGYFFTIFMIERHCSTTYARRLDNYF
jgi:PHS family inorganic phosphate transporter-like MFS transporter